MGRKRIHLGNWRTRISVFFFSYQLPILAFIVGFIGTVVARAMAQ